MASPAKKIETLYGGVPAADPSKYPHHNFHRVIKDLVSKLSQRNKLSGEKQETLLLHIANETLGKSRDPKRYPRPPLWVCLTAKQLAKDIGCHERVATDILSDACKRGLIEELDEKRARGLGFHPAKHANARWYRLAAENWANVPRYIPRFDRRTASVRAGDAAPGMTNQDVPEERATVEEISAPSPVTVVAPGEQAGPVSVASESVTVDNRSSVPLLVELHWEDRNLVARVFDAPRVGRIEGESTPLERAGLPLPGKLRNSLSGLGLHCDDALIATLLGRLRCPVPFYVERVVSERLTRAKRKGEVISPALLPALADKANQIWPQAREQWERERAQTAEDAKRQRDWDSRRRQQALEHARDVMAHPEGYDARDIDLAQELLAERAKVDKD